MGFMKSIAIWRDAGVCLAGMFLCTGLAVLAHDMWRARHNVNALTTLAESAIKQVEYNIDYAILAAFEAAEKAPEPCSSQTRIALQSLVHGGSNLKDLIMLDAVGSQLCTAFSGLNRKAQVSSGVVTRNESFSLHRLSYPERDNLGVAWRDGARSYVVSLDLDAQLYTTLPGAIRDDSFNAVEIVGLGKVASFGREMGEGEAVEVSAASERFPVKAVLKLDNACFATWNGENRWPIAVLAGFLGLIIGAMAVRELRRPISPREALRRAVANHEIVPYAQATLSLQPAARLAVRS